MAAAPSPLQPGGRAPETGADPAASEVASSALRCLAGLAGQVSAGRAEEEAWGRAGPGVAGPAPRPARPAVGAPSSACPSCGARLGSGVEGRGARQRPGAAPPAERCRGWGWRCRAAPRCCGAW